MSLSVKERYVLEYLSEWIIAHKEEWISLYDAINDGEYMSFDYIYDGKEIKNQAVVFLKWLIELKQLIDNNSFSGKGTSFNQIFMMVKEKKLLLLPELPVIEPKNQNLKVDDIKHILYGLYNSFFEFVRQLDLLEGMSEEAIECYKRRCQKLSNKIKKFRESYDSNKIRQTIRDVNSKLDWSERIDTDDLRNFINQIQGWIEDRLFVFKDSIIPYQYLSIDELFKDLDFQYNYVQSKSKVLSLTYQKNIEPLASKANEIWKQFQEFYTEITQLNSSFAPTKAMEDFPIRTLFLLGKIPEMIESIRAVFASVPPIVFKTPGMQESHFHIAMHTMFKALRLKPFSELAINEGRSDMIVEKSETIYTKDMNGSSIKEDKKVLYILEFKISETTKDESDEAINQIKTKDYGFAYKDDYYKIYGIGLCFSTKVRNIFENKCEPTLLYENGKRMFEMPRKTS